jgi:hypothetical protein
MKICIIVLLVFLVFSCKPSKQCIKKRGIKLKKCIENIQNNQSEKFLYFCDRDGDLHIFNKEKIITVLQFNECLQFRIETEDEKNDINYVCYENQSRMQRDLMRIINE